MEYRKEIADFLMYVVLLTIPFYIAGYFLDLQDCIPIDLPISSLMFVCPTIAAFITIRKRRYKLDAGTVFRQIFDYNKKISLKGYFLTLLLLPILFVITYFIAKVNHIEIPPFKIHFYEIAIFFVLFFIASIGEEVGWTWFFTTKLASAGVLKVGVFLGFIWAIWHVIPYLQIGKSYNWIFWQCIATILLRILMVWIYLRVTSSVLSIILFHAFINVCIFTFPEQGSYFNPFYFSMVLVITVVIFILIENKSLNGEVV